MVYTDRSLHQLQLIHLKQPLYDVPYFCTAFPVQDFFSIFWYKYYVVCTIPLCMCRTFLLHFFVSCVLVRDALLPLLHFITGDFFLLNYCPCKTHCRTTGRACGFLLVLNQIIADKDFFSDGQDSTSVISVPLHFDNSKDIEFSFDLVIVSRNSYGNLQRLIHDKSHNNYT